MSGRLGTILWMGHKFGGARLRNGLKCLAKNFVRRNQVSGWDARRRAAVQRLPAPKIDTLASFSRAAIAGAFGPCRIKGAARLRAT
jgi:hypothetical protein